MLDILNEMFPENIANRVFMFVYHPIVDLIKGDSTYSEIMKYPSYIIDFNLFSVHYFDVQYIKKNVIHNGKRSW